MVPEPPRRTAKVRDVGTEVRRARRADARDNRWRILAVAHTAFAAEGPGVPIREVARRAEVSVATVYRHFPTKDALLAEALVEQTTLCSAIVEDGLAASDPWSGFATTVETLMEVHALDRGFAGALAEQLPRTADFASDRERTLVRLAELLRRAQEAGAVRPDLVLEDVGAALMAHDGLRAPTAEMRLAASRRFAALTLQSFRATAGRAPLPPAVPLPLVRG